jgi:hypothetical protein
VQHARKLDPHVRDPDHDDTGIARRAGPAAVPGTRRCRGLGDVLGGTLLAAERLDQPLHDGLRRHVLLADGGVERGDVRVAHLVGQRGQGLAREQPLQGQALLAHRAGDRVLAVLDRLLATLLGEPLPDLVAGPW